MVFSSLVFLIFFLPACLICYMLPAVLKVREDVCVRIRNGILLLFSLFFYAWGEPRCLPLLMISALVDYIDGRLLERFDNRPGLRRLCLILALLINFSLLGIFKYADFTIGLLNHLPGLDLPLPGIALPIGISFYTFQTTSYSIDVYRREVPAEKNYFRYLTYVSMFPQLIAGPIVRYQTVSRELRERSIPRAQWSDGFTRFLIGLFRKVLIANELGALWASLNGRASLSVAAAWLGLLSFTLQLYFDFSAYSDMAIGLGLMLGFHFNENFNYPLSAVSLTDFWRRWHISLSGWFRDYVYIPLGGNRHGRLNQFRNLFVVWFLTGLWHGASWNYVLWGLYHGLFLVLEKFVWGRALEKLPRFFRHIYALAVIVFGFGIFYFEDLGVFGHYLTYAFGAAGNPLIAADLFWALSNSAGLLVVALLLSFPVFPWFKEKLNASGDSVCRAAQAAGGIAAVVLFLFCVANLVRASYNPFLYFRF